MRGLARFIVPGLSCVVLLFLAYKIFSRQESGINVSLDEKNSLDTFKRKVDDQKHIQSRWELGAERVRHVHAPRHTDHSNKSPLEKKQKLIHLDLKGAAPSVSYLVDIFPLFKKMGATGLLIEYEDMFPYNGKLSELAAENSYSNSDIQTILSNARANGLTVMPLVQTFGHMEFVLKHANFSKYRESAYTPQAIRAIPCFGKSLDLIRMMIDQVLKLHSGIKHLHIGCDEVYNLGEGTLCQNIMLRTKLTKPELFVSHVRQVAEIVKKRGVQPVVWDDMYRTTPIEILKANGFNTLVEPMVWSYHAKVQPGLPDGMWERYSKVFRNIWIASAFKGATGVVQLVPSVDYHLNNQLSWLEIIKNASNLWPSMNVRGIAATGWQRYDHFATLCELLPVGIPSLAVQLSVLQDGWSNTATLERIQHLLHCSKPFDLKLTSKSDTNTTKCQFPASDIYEAVNDFRTATIPYEKTVVPLMGRLAGWMTSFHIKHSYSSAGQVGVVIKDLSTVTAKIVAIEPRLRSALSRIYQPDTVDEWIEVNVRARLLEIKEVLKKAEVLKQKSAWPRKPLRKAQQ